MSNIDKPQGSQAGAPKSPDSPFAITERTLLILEQSKARVRRLSIAGLIYSVVFIFFGVMSLRVHLFPGGLFVLPGIACLVLSLLLHRYAQRIRALKIERNQVQFDLALAALGSIWKWAGIVALVGLLLMGGFVLFIVFAIMSGGLFVPAGP